MSTGDRAQAGDGQVAPRAVSLEAAFGTFHELWSPRVVAELNGQEVKIARIQGAFDWHRHEEADELFLVVRGRMRLDLRNGPVELGEGELFVVPRSVEHRPVAEEETWILMFEPAGTLNTGNLRNERTVEEPERL